MNKEEAIRIHNLVTKKYEDLLEEGHECKLLLEKELKEVIPKHVTPEYLEALSKAIYDLTSNLTHICSELSYSVSKQYELEQKETEKGKSDGNK